MFIFKKADVSFLTAYQAPRKLDLHGLTIQQAFNATTDFVNLHLKQGSKDIVIVTGKHGKINHELPFWCKNIAGVSMCLPIIDGMGEHGSYRIFLKVLPANNPVSKKR